MNEQEPILTIRIKELRRERSLTQEELAEQLGLSRQSVNALEAGRCMPSLPVAFQIARFFSIPLSRVFVFHDEAMQAELERFEDSQNNSNYPPNHKGQEDNMTTLVPWSPLREMRTMLDDLLDESAWPVAPQLSVPAVNIHQTENEVRVEMRLPGFKKDDLSIEVGEDFITISGELKSESEKSADGKNEEDKQYFRREFMEQSFTRSMALPALVQSEKAEAEMKNGVLHVKIPKVVEEKPKTSKVSIKSVD